MRDWQFILKYRSEHPGVGPALSLVEGKGTIKPALDDFHEKNRLHTVSESTVGRVLSDPPFGGEIFPPGQGFNLNARLARLVERPMRPYRLKARRNGFRPTKPGDLVQMDVVYVFHNGIKRYSIGP